MIFKFFALSSLLFIVYLNLSKLYTLSKLSFIVVVLFDERSKVFRRKVTSLETKLYSSSILASVNPKVTIFSSFLK